MTQSTRLTRDLFSLLTLSGFVNSSAAIVDASTNEVQMTAQKPNFEVGAATKISFNKKKAEAAPTAGPARVTISNTNDDLDIQPAKISVAKPGKRLAIAVV